MKNNQEWDDVSKKFPEFINYVEDEVYILKLKLYIWICLLLMILSISILFGKSFCTLMSIIYTIGGACFISMGTIKNIKEVVLLSVARWGYSKPLAKEFSKNGYCNAVGLIMIVLSAVLQVIASKLL
ncbi:hypothetical protein HNV12_01705 [Methanococcoides sp. SA1]|nr:hypothetical protein [Methanococcoides sp. SA1]